jgi:hypothetical protein
MIGRTPHLKANNYLHSLTIVIDDTANAKTTAKQFLQKMKLIASIHEMLCSMWSKHKRSKRKPFLLEKGSKPLKDWLLDSQWSK